jgi:hypothetical protein
MNKKIEKDLENQENWDFEKAEAKEPARSPRVVVSVAYKNQDFDIVADYAERTGKKVSEFIREASLEKATGRGSTFSIHSASGTASIWCSHMLPNVTQNRIVEKSKEGVGAGVTYY